MEEPVCTDIPVADVSLCIALDQERGVGHSEDGGKRAVFTFGASGMTISIQNLEYSVRSNVNRREQAFLLKGVSGFFEPYKMSALMGPSGSGKTTLLDLLAGRKTAGTTTGDILFAGNKPTKQFLRRYTGYVEQQDTLLPILSVEEMLMYTAELKAAADKRAAVEHLLDKLGLAVCRNVRIGNVMSRGISGGQAKRTNIGIALITNPRVLFLDEPTSGLDSYTSNEVMGVVRTLAADGTTIIATIHSPTAYAFSLFDSLMMLVAGRVVYFGPRAEAITHVRQHTLLCQGMKEQTPEYTDAEWLIDLFTDADRLGRASEFAEAYAQTGLKQDNDAEVLHLSSEKHDLPEQVQRELAVRTETVTPWYWALWVYVKYRSSKNYRSFDFLSARIFDKIIMGVLITTLYLGIGSDFKPNNIMNIAAVLFMWVTMPSFGAAAYVPSLSLELSLYVRERNDGLYRPITYLINKLADELGVAVIMSLITAAAIFYGVQFQGTFLVFWFTYFSNLCMGIVLAYVFAAASPSMDFATAALPTLVITWLFFAGFMLRIEQIPRWWYWYSVIDPVRYSWNAVMVNQFTAVNPKFLGGKTLLQYYGMAGQDAWTNIGYIWSFFAVFAFLAWLVLAFKRFQTR